MPSAEIAIQHELHPRPRIQAELTVFAIRADSRAIASDCVIADIAIHRRHIRQRCLWRCSYAAGASEEASSQGNERTHGDPRSTL